MAQINLRVDDGVKKDAEKTFEDIGLSMSAAINVFLKRLPERTAYRLNCPQTRFMVKGTWHI